MESKKRWHLWLIIAVLALTIYNVLPTVFFYTKPLSAPVDKKEASHVASSIATRVNQLEKFSSEWLSSFCHLLDVKPSNVKIEKNAPEYATVSFSKESDAEKFRRFLPRAGNFISFAPAQLSLSPADLGTGSIVTVQRRIPIHFENNQVDEFYQFTETTSPLYKTLVDDRVLGLASAIAGTSESAKLASTILLYPQDLQVQELAIVLGERVGEVASLFGADSSIAARFYASLSQSHTLDKNQFANTLLASISSIKDKIRVEKIALQKTPSLDPLQTQRLELLSSKETCLTEFEGLLRKYGPLFQKGKSAWNEQRISAELEKNPSEIVFGDCNPVFERLVIDYSNGKLLLKLHPDLLDFRESLEKKNASHYLKDQVDQVIYNQVAFVARVSSEKLSPSPQGNFTIALQDLHDSKSLLFMKLAPIAKRALVSLRTQIERGWHPLHLDLKSESFPIWDHETYLSSSAAEKTFGLLLYSPVASDQLLPEGMKMNSIYIIARGMDRILANLQANPNSESTKQFLKDFEALRTLLQQQGFYGYSGRSSYISSEFSNDFIFEKEDYYQDILKATRENFSVKGTKRFATLEFSNLEQRILAENTIDDKIHEDLLKWRDDYHAASLGIKGLHPYDVPKPTQNVFWSNLKLSTNKFFRGDDRKILKWGLDLSGGKTVQLELRDVGNRLVTNEADIRQGIEELHNRVNKMGVSEVSIRQEGHTISLDFPGSQAFSAAELVKASTMFFHVINEKFSSGNAALANHIEQFLQDVWNEAVITGRKTSEDINSIAWRHIHGDSLDPEVLQPRSSSARILHEQGLRLVNLQDNVVSSSLDDATTKIAMLRGDDYTDWHGHSHPLVFVFSNFALEGSSLDHVMASYDPSKGNFISFEVKGSSSKSTSHTSPRDDFEAWTTKYCKETIAGSSLADFSHGEGWRMAVVLNGSIISAPTLGSPLRTSASITGSFTQREINQLEADLKAGSLSFTPKILLEKNVSPELGNHERHLGILGMFLAIGLIVCSMVAYYRFSGIVASVAVLFNLVIMWAALQMLQATMTLASIAGIILTLGMAVDANVLVFERIKEEFSASGKIASAVHAGYRKAFSAILDSNITTLMAALVLLNFDFGPIKGLAITLIIGLISSMFTALFMTRYFFARWVQNPANKELKMANLFKVKHFNFLKYTKPTILFSLVVIFIGGFIAIAKKQTFLGMDFTGGYVLSFEVQKTPEEDYRQRIEHALVTSGLSSQDFLARELSPNNHLRLFLSSSMEQKGHPFYGLPLEYDDKDPSYPFQTNPRIVWIVNTLTQAGIVITPDSLSSLDQSWSSISGQMSGTMRNYAVIGLCIALLCILVYITIRFEFTYAASATLCLLHDIVFTVGVMALLHWIGVPIQVDLHTVAALLTIVGYSLNDTIIIFDRIREDMRLMHKQPIIHIINHALNATLSRTLMTSGTTLLVLIPLLVLGGSTIFSFALVMGIGVIFGTLSSLFIAAPLMLYFHRREVEKGRIHGATT